MVAIIITVAKQKLDVDSAKNMTYSAQGVHLTQTDEQGNLYIRETVAAKYAAEKHPNLIN